ncbi:hypothetical protein CCUS01_08477 [Colletotrichum cuscutae]|uniref:Uncharacterized protein n=1 Tax=Colletotrichum cuscutae TaxID=1209917 RepID=A0AAI9UTN2_9PEZI|nr:hypothetical protein CCUS01_08477 [Colletotrichum cuscutae]
MIHQRDLGLIPRPCPGTRLGNLESGRDTLALSPDLPQSSRITRRIKVSRRRLSFLWLAKYGHVSLFYGVRITTRSILFG